MQVQNVYDDVADFIANMNPQKILELRASEQSKERLVFLTEKEKESSLSYEEKDELDHYLVLERLIRLTKAHARQRLLAI